MSTDIQQHEHVREALHDGTLYLGYVSDSGGCDGCHFQRPRSCQRPLLYDSRFYCGAKSNNGKQIIWVAEVTA